MCLSGMGPHQIALKLSSEKVLRPSYHLKNIGMSDRSNLGNNPYGWSCTVVTKILERKDYLGHTTNFKYRRKSYKSDKIICLPENEQKIFENTHEAIISQEDWDAVQKIREVKRRRNSSGETNKFTGLLFCADCGSRLHYHRKPNKPSESCFQCGTYSYNVSKAECSSHYIRETVVEEIVLNELNKLIKAAQIDENHLINLISEYFENDMQKSLTKQKKELLTSQKRYDEIDTLFNKLYEDNVNGKLSDERFEKMSCGYETEQDELKTKIAFLASVIHNRKEKSDNANRFISIVKKYTVITELTTEILHEFIDKIIIHAPDKSSGRRVMRVNIYYNFVGIVNTAMLAA